MSVKHIEYLKVKDSKVLVVEIRPVRCLLDTPSGPVYTDKWMEHSHWKELHHLLMTIVDEYEEQRSTTQEVKCNQPKNKTSDRIQIGYMFRALSSHWGSRYFLTPRSRHVWKEKDDNDGGKLKDKGGRFESLVTCGEMLVVSVIFHEPAESSPVTVRLNSSLSHQQARVNKKLMKALDHKIESSNSISNYFPASNASDEGHSSRSVSSSCSRKKSSPERVK